MLGHCMSFRRIVGQFVQWSAVGLVLSGCGTLIDPAPYNPFQTEIGKPPILFTGATDAGGFRSASVDLLAMSNGYAQQRNALMQQQVLLDLALLGLTGAAIINPIFHGATASTVALGLGAGAAGATRVYLAPQTRVALYNSAAAALGCAAGVSGEMSDWYISSHDPLTRLQASLEEQQAAATVLLTGGGATGDAGTKLLAARDTAVAALGKTRVAVAALEGGAGRLRSFAIQTVNTTSKSVVTGTQNVDAALAKINSLSPAAPKTAAPSGSAGTPPPPGGKGVSMVGKPPTAMSAAELAATMNQTAAIAEATAGPVHDTWSRLTACTPSTS